MKYSLLYAYDPTQTGPSDAEIDAWLAFDAAVKEAGVFVYEAGLHPAKTAQTVRVRDGQTSHQRGPLAGSGESIAGFYILDVADMQSALDWAARLPTAAYGAVEVRAIVEF